MRGQKRHRGYGAVLSAEVMGLQLGADRFLGMRKNFLACGFVRFDKPNFDYYEKQEVHD